MNYPRDYYACGDTEAQNAADAAATYDQAKLRRQQAHENANPACVVMDGVSAASCIALASATAPKRYTMSWANPDGSKGSPSKHWSNLSLADAGRCFNARLADKHRAALDALGVGQCYTDFDGDYWERVQ